MPEGEVRYCTTEDGVRIAYCSAGDGPPLVVTPFFTESLSLHHLAPQIDLFLDRLRSVRRVVLYDARGIGLSQRDALIDPQTSQLDLEAVIAASGYESVAIWANFIYVFPAIRYAVQHPEGVERLVLFASMVQRSAVFPDDVVRSFIDLVKTNWPLAAQTFGDMSTRQADPAAGLRWGELNRESATADAVECILQAGIDRDEDIRSELANVTAPTLVMHRSGDLNIPLKMGQQVAAAIPNAVFVPVPGVMTHPALGDQEPVFRAALPFLSAGGEAASPPSGAPAFRTVLFTDLVGHRTFAAGRYTVVRQLGEGGQKTVYLVHDTTLDRHCALALLKTEAMDAEGIFRIKREAQAMGSLTHPNIVIVYDVGEEDGRPYIVCEYIPGGDLQQELRRAAGPLPLDRALAIGQDVCRALAAAHQRGITHRDVKPGNIWLMEDGGAKLGDFGLALAIDRSRLTMEGTTMGTAAYMAPEQAQGQATDARSDLYSLGCLLYELATGRPPFMADDPIAVVSQHIHATPLPPSHYHADVPERLERLILNLLAKAQGERPSSAGAVLHELGEIAARK